ncbi:Plasmodium exported protein, unknown function [Plasmodium vivax]|uniref:Variable surface protein Vir35 n=2 Tax=Plasmodium vivax TaxID=5855 RepID=A0A1G4H773_PLAVI|nr:Plasmodium exported protein, unknown function [Plasmodium vivax]
MKEKILFPLFIKNFIFFLLSLGFCLYNESSYLRNYLYSRSNLNVAPDKITLRILAKHDLRMESDYIDIKSGSSEFVDNEKIKNVEDGVSIYERMQKNYSKKFAENKKLHKNKYAKKKGISKLDCYCEEKIFNRIDEMKKLAKNMGNDKNNFKNILHKKYGFKFTLSCLFPYIGIIISSIYGAFSSESNQGSFVLGTLNIPEQAAQSVVGILIILNFIILSVIFYIIIKFIKYEKLKAGKGKMGPKEYYYFCKDLYMNK